ncbi:unnamed protein product [Caenorhabditis angaria]|uniref:RSD-2 N-terminal domain-containing protein n=1 Tax=Caenorhabditis angaria TaxID=860376 RepID=A0A9P1J2T9_9PELO|nr:unnamed protein product [Caenorhabditis angaria]
MEIVSNVIVLSIQDGIIYAFSKMELKLYRLRYREELGIEIGMFITFEKTDGFVMDVTTISEKRMADKNDLIRIETLENGPTVCLQAWMVFSKNPSLRSYKMLTGFSDWYGYIRIIEGTMKKRRNFIYAVNIIIDDLNYDQKIGATLFRQHTKYVGKPEDRKYNDICERCERRLKSRNALESICD